MKYFLLITIIIFSFACTKSNDNVTEVVEKSPINQQLLEIPCSGQVNLNELHNETVTTLLDGVDFVNGTYYENIDRIWMNYYELDIDCIISQLNIARSEFNIMSNTINEEVISCEFDIRNSTTYSISGMNAYPYICDLLSLVDEFDENTTLEQMFIDIDNIETEAIDNLEGEDWYLFYGMCNVLRGSSELWLPVSMGGLGHLDKSLGLDSQKLQLSDEQKRIIGNCLLADASAMAIGLQVTAWTALATGGTLAPVALVATCVEAALSSAFAALF